MHRAAFPEEAARNAYGKSLAKAAGRRRQIGWRNDKRRTRADQICSEAIFSRSVKIGNARYLSFHLTFGCAIVTGFLPFERGHR